MTLFDMYVPSREADSIEVRLRSDFLGAIDLSMNDREVVLEQPNISYRGCHFYRHRFEQLNNGTICEVKAVRRSDGSKRVVRSETLVSAGTPKLKIGVLSDVHLPPIESDIDHYRGGVRRLSGLAKSLLQRYIKRLEALGADLIVFPGDVVDPCTPETLAVFTSILETVSIPCYPIIGNHEPWSKNGEMLFYRILGLPEHGYYSTERNGVRLLMLSTPDQDALDAGSDQFRWLEQMLEKSNPQEDIVVLTHFALYLQKCVSGYRNDGYQLLDNHQAVNRLLERHSNVRIVITGHKNVPSMMVKNGIIHTLSPQLIQAPCGYDLFTLFDGGVSRTTYEIEEQHVVEVARSAYGDDYCSRYGEESGRNFVVSYQHL